MENPIIYIPQNLNMQAHMLEHPCDYISPRMFEADRIAYVISLIYSIPANNPSLLLRNGFTPINSRLLHNTIKDPHLVLKYAVETGMLICDNTYTVGKKSKGYRLSDKYNTPLVPYEVTRWSLKRNIWAQRKKQEVEAEKSALSKWFNDKIEIDYRGAKAHALKVLVENQNEGDRLALDKYIAHMNCIDKIAAGDYVFSKDTVVGRLHTTFTSMPFWVRNFMSYDGGKLVNVDIKNSQPYLATALFNPEFFEIDFEMKRKAKKAENLNKVEINIKDIIDKKEEEKLGKVKLKSVIDNIIVSIPTLMLRGTSENQSAQNELKFFAELTGKGKLYDYLKQEIEKRTGEEFKQKADVKLSVLLAFFTSNHFIGQKEAAQKRIFKEIFPTVYKILSAVKKKDYSFLPRLLQSLEAKIVLDRICTRISRERPNMPIYTIHDSVVCPEGQEDYVSNVIIEEMKRSIGHPCSVGIEYWRPETVVLCASRKRKPKKRKKLGAKPRIKLFENALSLPLREDRR